MSNEVVEETADAPATESSEESSGLAASIVAGMRENFEKDSAPQEEPAPEPEEEQPEASEAEETDDSKEESDDSEEESEKEETNFDLDSLTAVDDEDEEGDISDEVPEDVKEQGEKATARWGELRKKEKEYDKLAQENQELQSRLEKSASPDVTKEIEQLRSALEEKEKIITAVAVTESDEYQNAVMKPLAALEEQASSLATDEEQEGRIIAALADTNLKSRNQKLSDLSEEMNSYGSAKLVRIVDEIDAIFEKDKEIRAKSGDAKQEIDRNQLAATAEETEKEKAARLAVTEKIQKNIVDNVPFLKDDEGNVLEKYQGVLEKGAGAVTPDSDMKTMALAGYAVHLFPELVKEVEGLKGSLADKDKTIKALKGSSPKVGNTATEAPKEDKNLPLAKRIAQGVMADLGG